MKILLRVLLGIVGAVVLLALLLAFAVTLLVDPENYRPIIAEQVQRATGRTLTLEGELGLNLFPCCAITVERAALGNPPGFPEGEFARVASAALSLKLWPLITRREVEIGTVRLDGLNADLLVRADGAANWEFGSTEQSAAASAGGASGATRLAVAGLAIRNGRVSYRDEQEQSKYLAEDLELSTGELVAGAPFDLSLTTKLTDETDGTTGRLAVKAAARIDPAFTTLTLAKPRIDVEASGAAIPAKNLRAVLGAAELAIEAKEDTVLQFRSLEGEFTLPGLHALAGDAEGSFIAGDARVSVGKSTELMLPKLDVTTTISGKGIPGDTISASVKAGAVALDVDKLWGSVAALSADVNGLGAKLALTANGRIAGNGAALKGTMTLDPLSPRSVLAVLQQPVPPTADSSVLTRFAGSADWVLGKDSLEFGKLDVQLDQTRITGRLALDGFAKPLTRFDVTLDALDLDRYLAPEAAAEAGGGASGGGAAPSPVEDDIPVETLRDLRLDGRVAVGQLVVSKMKLADVSATVRADAGRLRLDPLAAQVFGGQFRGSVSVDATGPTAKLTLDQQLTDLQVAPALQELFDTGKLTGALSGRINASGTGNTTEALLQTLAGSIAVNVADGAWLGTDLWYEIRRARAMIRGDAPPAAPAKPQTGFNAMELAGTLSDGQLRAERLLAEIPFIRLSGSGALGLVDPTMDFKLLAQVFETPTFEDGSSIKDLKGVTIPLTLKGATDKPKVSVDLKNLVIPAATQKLKDRLLEKLGEKPAPAEGTAPAEGEATGEPAVPAEQPPKEEKPRDILKRGLRDLLKQTP